MVRPPSRRRQRSKCISKTVTLRDLCDLLFKCFLVFSYPRAFRRSVVRARHRGTRKNHFHRRSQRSRRQSLRWQGRTPGATSRKSNGQQALGSSHRFSRARSKKRDSTNSSSILMTSKLFSELGLCVTQSNRPPRLRKSRPNSVRSYSVDYEWQRCSRPVADGFGAGSS